MMDFLNNHPFLTMTIYILMLTVSVSFLVEWKNRRERKRWRDEHAEHMGNEAGRVEE